MERERELARWGDRQRWIQEERARAKKNRGDNQIGGQKY